MLKLIHMLGNSGNHQGVSSMLDTIKKILGLQSGGPEALQRLLLVVGSLSIALIVTFSAWGFYRVFNGFVIKSAEADAVGISKVMLNLVSDEIIERQGAGQRVRVAPGAHEKLDHALKPVLRHFDVVKVKLFDDGKRIPYSTDSRIIGKVDAANKRLARALNGMIDTQFTVKSVVADLAEEKRFGVDVVETYVPIYADDRSVIGSFEVYLDVTRYRRMVQIGVAAATAILAAVLLVVFAISHLFLARYVRMLRDAHAQLSQMAITDVLTGVANRRALIERGEQEFSRMRRTREQIVSGRLGCIVCDVDHFKKVNDLYGHLAGDLILKEFAARLQQCGRAYDLVGRFGGEEFVVLLPDTGLEEARIAAERMLASIRDAAFNTGSAQIMVTASAGVTCNISDDEGLDDLLRRADTALYRAKETGRDRVVVLAEQNRA